MIHPPITQAAAIRAALKRLKCYGLTAEFYPFDWGFSMYIGNESLSIEIGPFQVMLDSWSKL